MRNAMRSWEVKPQLNPSFSYCRRAYACRFWIMIPRMCNSLECFKLETLSLTSCDIERHESSKQVLRGYMSRKLRYLIWRWRIHKKFKEKLRAQANSSNMHPDEKNRSYFKERRKQREHLNSQIAHLDRLLESNSVGEDTYVRSKKLLRMNYKQKREATREKYGFTNWEIKPKRFPLFPSVLLGRRFLHKSHMHLWRT